MDTYTPMIFAWCNQLGVVDRNDAEDITQRLMCKLVEAMKHFSYDPEQSFRSWLRVSTRNAVYRFWNEDRKYFKANAIDLDALLDREDLIERLETEFDVEIEANARQLVKQQVSQRDWQVFEMLTEMPDPPSDIAKHFDISVDLVYKIKSRIVKMLANEIENLQLTGMQGE